MDVLFCCWMSFFVAFLLLVATFVAPTCHTPAALAPWVGATRVATRRDVYPVGRCWSLLVAIGRDFRRSYRSLLRAKPTAALALRVGEARAATCRDIRFIAWACIPASVSSSTSSLLPVYRGLIPHLWQSKLRGKLRISGSPLFIGTNGLFLKQAERPAVRHPAGAASLSSVR